MSQGCPLNSSCRKAAFEASRGLPASRGQNTHTVLNHHACLARKAYVFPKYGVADEDNMPDLQRGVLDLTIGTKAEQLDALGGRYSVSEHHRLRIKSLRRVLWWTPMRTSCTSAERPSTRSLSAPVSAM